MSHSILKFLEKAFNAAAAKPELVKYSRVLQASSEKEF